MSAVLEALLQIVHLVVVVLGWVALGFVIAVVVHLLRGWWRSL